jgi:Gly-Xaa carboxypeptidase
MARRFALLSLVSGWALAINVPAPDAASQHPLTREPASTDFKCDLPPIISPSGDGLPAASELFSSKEALKKQVERHTAVVQVPSICFDDLGDFDTDKRWGVFYTFHDVLAETYPVI